jgi:hypothetical protein
MVAYSGTEYSFENVIFKLKIEPWNLLFIMSFKDYCNKKECQRTYPKALVFHTPFV